MISYKIPNQRPSSFPGIWKIPTDRQLYFRSALDWISGKRADDELNRLWRVHDKIYDLESFIRHHPGGSDWIDVTRGTDITEAFETSHILNLELVEETLSQYFVKEATERRISPYSFREDGFYKILKSRIVPILQVIGTHSTSSTKLMVDLIGILFLLTMICGTFWNCLTLQILSGLLLTMTGIGGHNFLHLRDNWRKYYIDFTLMSSYEFRITHILSHHLFPNTVLDFEVGMLEPFLEFLPKRNKYWIQQYGSILYGSIFYIIHLFLGFVQRWNSIIHGKREFRAEYMLVLIQLFTCTILGETPFVGFLCWNVIQMSSSYFFFLIGIGTSSHHHPMIFHDGDEARSDPDFGLCQLDAIRDRSDSIFGFVFVQLFTFGEQSLHHLFPTVCQSKLPYLRLVLEETLEDFSEKFPEMTQWELFIGTLQQLRRIERHGIHTQKKYKTINAKLK